MKGNLVNAMIGVMVGAVLIFAVVAPILNNATLGTLYEGEALTVNGTVGATTQVFLTDCNPIRNDKTYFTFYNSTGDDVSAVVAITSATNGVLTWTNGTTTVTGAKLDYRCYDSNYIANNTGRTVANFLLPLILIILIVGLTGLIMK